MKDDDLSKIENPVYLFVTLHEAVVDNDFALLAGLED